MYTALSEGYIYGRYEDSKFTEWELGKRVMVNAMYCIEDDTVYRI